ncbi:hypothetical protein [Micromonospora sp. NPDC000668]|uniref:hypothetical protein n=1 Tax=Micromonospora sp. NPDC000668 TaxID=3364219 RepID=UPI0036B02434
MANKPRHQAWTTDGRTANEQIADYEIYTSLDGTTWEALAERILAMWGQGGFHPPDAERNDDRSVLCAMVKPFMAAGGRSPQSRPGAPGSA